MCLPTFEIPVPTKFYFVRPYGELSGEITAQDLSEFCRYKSRRRIIRKPSKILINGSQCNVRFFTDINNGERGREKSKKREDLSEALIQSRGILQG